MPYCTIVFTDFLCTAPFALLQVVCAKVKYLLAAENCEERDAWLGHINKVFSGEPEPGVTCTCVCVCVCARMHASLLLALLCICTMSVAALCYLAVHVFSCVHYVICACLTAKRHTVLK